MAIPSNLKGRYAYHFTHTDNLESIIENGVLCTNLKNSQNVPHTDVAEQGIQERRSLMPVPGTNGKKIHDFVPFYFSKKTSMQLGVINKKNVDQPLIIYLAVPLEIIELKSGVVFTDASANTDVPPNFYNSSNVDQLNSLNWGAIDDNKWGCPTEEYRHQKMAELLVPDSINFSDVAHIIVWNDFIKDGVESVFKNKGLNSPKIVFDRDHYYINFYDGGKQSIVTGPKFLKSNVDRVNDEICKSINGVTKFTNITAALDSVVRDFSSIKELDDINGLRASYWPHSEDVGVHSRNVAAALVNFSEYNDLSHEDKEIVMLSAFMHDIGKGPKTRWPHAEMKRADNDHAVKSLPMLKRILTEDIGSLNSDIVRKIVLLVVYDDLVGDIVGKGRNEQQLFDIVDSENDINMLIALGKADMFSINPSWVASNDSAIDILKSKAIAALR